MLSDFDVIVHKLPKEDIVIYPIADLHIGDPDFDLEGWNNFIKQIRSIKNAYVILAGDLMNNALKSSVSNVYAESMRPMEQKRYLASCLSEIRDKILCAVPGNHERRTLREVDNEPIYDIMCKLDLEDVYRPNMAFVELELGDSHNQYRICVTHGSGGGIKTGGSVNRNEAFGYIIEGLDALITGHTHKGVVTKPQKLVINAKTKKVELRDFIVLTATSWNGYSDYALQKQLNPASNGIQALRLTANTNHIKPKKVEVIW